MIKTIFFDIGGVLLNIYPERTVEYISSITNLSEQKIRDSFPEKEHQEYERGELSNEGFFNAVTHSLPINNSISSTDFWKAWGMMVGEKTGVASIMEELTKQYSIWLLSNTNPYHIIKEERLKIFNNISGAIYSYAVGSRKPEIEIFEKAVQTANTTPAQSLFIDDLRENVDMAISLNFNAIHFVSIEDLRQKLNYFGVM